MDSLRLDRRAPLPAHSLPFAVPSALRPVPAEPAMADPSLYFNRELSWVDFNWRVLHQAMDERLPLLERVRFLAITQSNLDEFFRTRVGGLKRQVRAGVTQLSPDGRSPSEQLQLIHAAVASMQEAMDSTWLEQLHPALVEQGIGVRGYDSLGPAEQRRVAMHFRRTIYPVLTPLAVDPGHPFPFISDASLSLAVELFHPTRPGKQFARLKVPTGRSRWIPLDEPGQFLPLESLVARHMDQLFPGTEVDGVHAFRVARNADLWREDDEAEDLLEMISEELRERRFAPAVRLEVDQTMPGSVVDLLCSELDLDPSVDVYRVKGLIDYGDLKTIADLDRPELRFPPWEPVAPAPFRPATPGGEPPSVFATVRKADRLVHHPYDSFSASVLRFLDEAADDPRVLAIKMTLYRTSENSPVVRALVRAADKGKQVAVLVEVTARFDEARNIQFGQTLEQAGVHVTYGLIGLKTHSKVALVVREDEDGIRTYCHLGTGNYHLATARLYADLGLLTADAELGEDIVRLFHYLTGHAPEQRYTSLLVSPRDLRGRLEELVGREVEHARAGRSARIVLKMNGLDDVGMIQALYRASQAGVRVELIVRGHTRLRPGVPGVSERIRLRSIVGRFLEHDRIFWFENGGNPDVLIGSADWRRRNLEERVEAVMRIQDPELKARLGRMLDLALADNRLAWELTPHGTYHLLEPREGEPVRSYHDTLMQEALGSERPAPASAGEQSVQIA